MKKIDLITFWLKIIAALLAFDILFRVFGSMLMFAGH